MNFENGYGGVFGSYSPERYRLFLTLSGRFSVDEMYLLAVYLEEKIKEFDEGKRFV